MNRLLFIVLFLIPSIVFSQEKIEGLVINYENQKPLDKILIYNANKKERTFIEDDVEFSMFANFGDTVIFMRGGFQPDTLFVTDKRYYTISLKQVLNRIEPVDVVGKRSPEQILADVRNDYSKAYQLADPGPIINYIGLGFSLNIYAIYNRLSKEGKNARRFTAMIDALHKENVIDYRFTKDLVRQLVSLEDEALQHFIKLFRPSYEFVVSADDADMAFYIISNYKLYKENPKQQMDEQLPKINMVL